MAPLTAEITTAQSTAPPISPVQQLLHDLSSDQLLQGLFSASTPQQIVAICEQRGVYVNPALLSQFIAQVSPDEGDDQELSLEQLEDVAGGLGFADVMITGAVLAVVASNAGGLMSQAQAAMGGGNDGPVASLTANAEISAQVNTLESLGIQVVVGDPSIEGATAEWDSSSRTMTISQDALQQGAPTVLQAMNHEAVHVAQSCNAGGVGQAGTALGVAVSGESVQAVQHSTYDGVSAEEKQMELEAYSLTNEAGAGMAAAVQHCSAG